MGRKAKTDSATTAADGTEKPSKETLFAAYREVDAEVAAAKAVKDSADDKLGQVADEIVKAYGPGPFNYGGTLIRARKEQGGHYVFKGFSIENIPAV